MFKTIIAILILPFAILGFGIIALLFLVSTFLVPSHKIFWVVRVLTRSFLLFSGQILKIEGTVPDEKEGPFLYLFNHGSMFDVFMMGAGVKHYVTSVGAAKQFSWPIWGTMVKRYGVIPIPRKNLKKAIHSLSLMEKAILNGTSCIISPEGTRTLTGQMLPFKKGPFHVAMNTGVTLIPVGLIGAYEAKKKPDWRIKPGIIKIRFGSPITKDEYKNDTIDILSEKVRVAIVNLMKMKKN